MTVNNLERNAVSISQVTTLNMLKVATREEQVEWILECNPRWVQGRALCAQTVVANLGKQAEAESLNWELKVPMIKDLETFSVIKVVEMENRWQ